MLSFFSRLAPKKVTTMANYATKNAHASVPGASQSPSAWRRRPDPEAKRATETAKATPAPTRRETHGAVAKWFNNP